MDKFQLDVKGSCKSCKKTPIDTDLLKCYLCKGLFHGTCSEDKNEQVAAKTTVRNFNLASTKNNFKFLCNCCLTKFEIDQSKADSDRLTVVENNVGDIKSELAELKTLLKNGISSQPIEGVSELKDDLSEIKSMINSGSCSDSSDKKDNIWHNEERLKVLKIPPSNPMLILNNRGDANNNDVEKTIVDNKIPVTKTFKNNKGDLVLVCETVDSRDKLKTLIANSDTKIDTKSVDEKKPGITIVGMNYEMSKSEVVEQIISQNQFIRNLSLSNDINDHIKIHDIKPTKAKPGVFQAFASVSALLRKGIKTFNDKLTVGITVCKVYDRFNVRRCNNCQGLGHFYKECPTPNVPVCANCAGSHSTNNCTSNNKVCINCKNAGDPHSHAASDPLCKTMLDRLENMKSKNLN